MALNNFDASIVGRSDSCRSHNVIKKAAYNGREKLTDERTNETWNYAAKDGLEWKGLFLPRGAPEWMNDRQKLYQEIERKEDAGTKPDKAQLMHSWILTLPHELSAEQRKWFMTDFARELARKGRIVDVALHTPDEAGSHLNYHAHVLMTMREVNADGFGKKITAPDVKRGDPEGKRKFQNWAKEELAGWKDRYSEMGAHALERAGYAVEAGRFRVGHKTLKEQLKAAQERGDTYWIKHLTDREPTRHMGPQATAMERKDEPIRTRKGDRNREIEDRNWLRQNDRDLEEFLKNLPTARRPNDQVIKQAIPIWWAYECSKDAKAFQENLKKEGFELARVDKDDADASRTRQWAANRLGGDYTPIFSEGEYVAVDKRGQTYRLNERTTGRDAREIKAFMAELDKTFVNSLRAAENFALHKLEVDGRPTGRHGKSIKRFRGSRINRKAERAAGMLVDVGMARVNLLGSLIDPSLTPKQKVSRDLNTLRKRISAEQSMKKSRARDEHVNEQKQDFGRER